MTNLESYDVVIVLFEYEDEGGETQLSTTHIYDNKLSDEEVHNFLTPQYLRCKVLHIAR